MKTSYAEKLRHPKWQRKRLEILGRDGFTCQHCNSETKTLHVHHGYYEKGFDPWDYDNDTLVSLCEDCHKQAELQRAEIYRGLAMLESAYLEKVYGYVQALKLQNADVDTGAKEIVLRTIEEVEGFCDAILSVEVDHYEVIKFAKGSSHPSGIVNVTYKLLRSIRDRFGP